VDLRVIQQRKNDLKNDELSSSFRDLRGLGQDPILLEGFPKAILLFEHDTASVLKEPLATFQAVCQTLPFLNLYAIHPALSVTEGQHQGHTLDLFLFVMRALEQLDGNQPGRFFLLHYHQLQGRMRDAILRTQYDERHHLMDRWVEEMRGFKKFLFVDTAATRVLSQSGFDIATGEGMALSQTFQESLHFRDRLLDEVLPQRKAG